MPTLHDILSLIDPNTVKGSWGLLVLVVGLTIGAALGLRILMPIKSTPVSHYHDNNAKQASTPEPVEVEA